MTELEFVEFPKMARMSRECIVTEKIDGTNAQILIAPGGPLTPNAIYGWYDDATRTDMVMLAGSRSRWVVQQDDNHGFAKWVDAHAEELVKLGPGRHYGEWWGSGIQRGYGLLNGNKRFSLFNVARWCLDGDEPQRIPNADPRIVKMQEEAPACCGLVPVLFRGEFSTQAVEESLHFLKCHGSVAARGFMRPEGVVCFHVAGNFGFKKTIHNDEVPKALIPKPMVTRK